MPRRILDFPHNLGQRCGAVWQGGPYGGILEARQSRFTETRRADFVQKLGPEPIGGVGRLSSSGEAGPEARSKPQGEQSHKQPASANHHEPASGVSCGPSLVEASASSGHYRPTLTEFNIFSPLIRLAFG
jgi:hypothetical protein